MKTKPITFDRFVRLLMSIVLLGVIYLLVNRLSSVLIPFLVAWLIAYLLYPIVHFIQYRCRVKSRAASITITGFSPYFLNAYMGFFPTWLYRALMFLVVRSGTPQEHHR